MPLKDNFSAFKLLKGALYTTSQCFFFFLPTENPFKILLTDVLPWPGDGLWLQQSLPSLHLSGSSPGCLPWPVLLLLILSSRTLSLLGQSLRGVDSNNVDKCSTDDSVDLLNSEKEMFYHPAFLATERLWCLKGFWLLFFCCSLMRLEPLWVLKQCGFFQLQWKPTKVHLII